MNFLISENFSYIEVTQVAADGLVNADLTTAGGNHVIQEALTSFVEIIDSKAFLEVQDNNKSTLICCKIIFFCFSKQTICFFFFLAIVFIEILRECMTDVAGYYGDLSSTITYGGNSLLRNAIVEPATYLISCSDISDVVISVNARLAEIYENIAKTFVTARQNILSYT